MFHEIDVSKMLTDLERCILAKDCIDGKLQTFKLQLRQKMNSITSNFYLICIHFKNTFFNSLIAKVTILKYNVQNLNRGIFLFIFSHAAYSLTERWSIFDKNEKELFY